MLVELIYSIMKAHHTNIVLFFELSYFTRILRIMTDPLLTSTKNNKKYKDIIGLLQFILQSFFECAQVNRCVFAELLFRKEQQKGEIESTDEFAAILDNYEDQNFQKNVFDRIEAGVTSKEMKEKQKELTKGQQPWTEEEDNCLKENYPLYSDHPMCAELLNTQLPETSRRTPVRRRLAELGLTRVKGKDKGKEDDGMPPSKKVKVAELHLEEGEDHLELQNVTQIKRRRKCWKKISKDCWIPPGTVVVQKASRTQLARLLVPCWIRLQHRKLRMASWTIWKWS
eukprot:symbB.v1.2.012190.t1/scaffold835.1/size159100/17